jgi:predicted RNA-binding protein with PIN domain
MHYFIDGYNMLFRLLHDSDDLQSKRESIIYDLNKKISLVKLNVSVVFDATSQIGGRSRSHYDQIEILFSAEGETADEYILDEIKNTLHPQQETVITSDKKLAWLVRNRSAHTESVEEFMLWLNRAYKNKLRQRKNGKQSSLPTLTPLTPASSSTPPPASPSMTHSLIPTKNAPLEAYSDYYRQVFEAEWQDILKEEDKHKQTFYSPPSSPPKCPPRQPKPRRPRDPFQSPQTAEEQANTEMERWLKTFEKRLSDPDSDLFSKY